MRWAGFRKVRGQVRKRLARRLGELKLPDLVAYQEYLRHNPDEWIVLDTLCRITISRFYRDRGVFDALRVRVLPEIAEGVLSRVLSGVSQPAIRGGDLTVRCWSVGCASGEEPYTVSIIWTLAVAPDLDTPVPLEIVATEANSQLLDRAAKGIYGPGSLKDMPAELADAAFDRADIASGRPDAGFAICDRFKKRVEFVNEDIRDSQPAGMFHLVLCRNLVFTYFDDALQKDVLERITQRLVPGGFLIVGIHESIPRGFPALVPWDGTPGIYRISGTAAI